MILDLNEIKYSPLSLTDDFGPVFFYQNRTFRGINHEKEKYSIDLLNSELFHELFTKNLIVKTWISEFTNPKFSIILEHELLQESKPHQWSFNMYKDAALLTLEINEICNKYGYELKDAHPYNILFKDNKPIFVDFGSIIKKNDKFKPWVAYEQFIYFNCIQLLYWSKGDFFTARRLIEDGIAPIARTIPMNSIFESLFIKHLEQDIFNYHLINNIKDKRLIKTIIFINRIFKKLFGKELKKLVYKREFPTLTQMRDLILKTKRAESKSYWGSYHDFYKEADNINSSPRFRRIIEVVSLYSSEIKTSLDLAGNQGIFSYLLSKKIKLDKIILTDYDEVAIDKAYLTFKEKGIKIVPLLYNFMIPLRDDEINHLKADVVFALAITHHLILTQNYSLSTIFRKITLHTCKFVVIEFMPLGLWVEGASINIPNWYNINWFREEFNNYFQLLTEEVLETNRVLFFGKKLNNNN